MKFITEKFYGLCISIDGPKEINDMQRFGNNKSVHDQIIETIDMLVVNLQ
jgi:sulfatase maturation enzyme AslB (radical SAM superfamily)